MRALERARLGVVLVLQLVSFDTLLCAPIGTADPARHEGVHDPNPAEDCAECRMEGDRAVLCLPHRKAEETVFADVSDKLSSDNWKERSSALVRIAELTQAHENAPTQQVAQALAAGLADPAIGVRFIAAYALRHSQYRGVAIPAMLDALRRSEDEIKEKDERWKNLRKEYSRARKRSRRKQETPDLRTNDDSSYGIYLSLVVQGLAERDDGRCVDGLVEFLGRGPGLLPKDSVEKACEGLLDTGTERGFLAVINLATLLEKSLRRGPVEGIGQDHDVEVDGYFDVMWRIQMAGLDPPDSATLELILRGLVEGAENRGLTGFPAAKGKTAKELRFWKKWIVENRGAFADKLGEQRRARKSRSPGDC